MKAGAILKTKDVANSGVDYFFLYSDKGSTRAGSVAEATILGTLIREESRLLTDWAYVKLDRPSVYEGKTYEYAYIKSQSVYEYTESLKTYYVTTTKLNVRSTPASTSAANVLGTVSKGVAAGQSDGQEKNGFVYVRLAVPLKGQAFGWLSKAYLTRTPPAAATGTAATSGSTADTTSAESDELSPTEKGKIIIENATGTELMDFLKWASIAALAFVAGYMAIKLYRSYQAKHK